MQKDNNVNNNGSTGGQGFQTHLIQYPKPLYAVIGIGIEEMYGLVIANTCHTDDQGRTNIRTWRIPLTGPEMQPCDARDEDAELIILPGNRELCPADLKKYIRKMKQEQSIVEGIDELCKWGFYAPIHTGSTVKVQTVVHEGYISLCSPWFEMDVSTYGRYPDAVGMLNLCAVHCFLRRKLHFVPYYENEGEDDSMAGELNRLMAVFDGQGLLTEGQVFNDGTYTYSRWREPVPMTREEFIAEHPSAYSLYKDK